MSAHRLKSDQHQLLLPGSAGFTLIELLIATTLGALMLITASAMFFIITLNSAKVEANKTIKASGASLKRDLDFLIKSATQLLPDDTGQSCTQTETSLTNLKLVAPDQGVTDFKLVTTENGTFIASNSTYLNPAELTPADLQFSCIQNANGETYVHYQFDLSLASLATQHFSSFVLLRNL